MCRGWQGLKYLYTSVQVLTCSVGLLYLAPQGNLRPLMSNTDNPAMRLAQRKPHRLAITVSDHVYRALVDRSQHEGRSISSAAAFVLEVGLTIHQQARP